MFGVRRCPDCGSMITEMELRCVGCGRANHPAVGPPLLCELCHGIKGQNPECERCNPPPAERPPPPPEPPPVPRVPLIVSARKLVVPRTRPLLIGALACALALFTGYEWGQLDRTAADEEVFEQMRTTLLGQLDKEREQFEAEREGFLAAHSPDRLAPAGMRWGDWPGPVRSVLSKQVHFVADGSNGRTYFQRYAGKFSNLPTDEIRAEFCNGRFSSLTVTLSTAGASLYRKWRDVFEVIRGLYGEPSSVVRPPSAELYETELAHMMAQRGVAAAATAPELAGQLLQADSDSSAADALVARWDANSQSSIVLAPGTVAQGKAPRRTILTWVFERPELSASCNPETVTVHR